MAFAPCFYASQKKKKKKRCRREGERISIHGDEVNVCDVPLRRKKRRNNDEEKKSENFINNKSIVMADERLEQTIQDSIFEIFHRSETD
jgi:hypothetical protein